jgi:glycosyltransferase involved in cell wall biosynthesis
VSGGALDGLTVAHVATVASSLRYLLLPQLEAARDAGATVIGISADGPDVEVLAAAGIEHVALASSRRQLDPLADLRSARDLWRLVRERRIDVLHTHTPKPGVYGRIVGRVAGVPAVVNTNHGLFATERDGLPRRLAVWTAEGVASRFSHAELLQNSEDLAFMERRRLLPRGKAVLLGNGIDLARFTPVPDTAAGVGRETRRRELGATDGTVVVGFVGRLVAEKGIRELLAAARLLDDRYVVALIGPADPDKSDALDAAELDRSRAAGVEVLGHRLDVDEWYRAMDLFVLPSYREGFPRAAMEAAASGVPVIASDVRGCRQVVDHGTTGLLVPAGDPDALAAAIRRLGEDPDLRSAMGTAAAALAREEFDERRVVEIVLGTYQLLTGRSGAAADVATTVQESA